MPVKTRYETDPYNRLIATRGDSSIPKQRRVMDGRFHIAKGNSLEYRIKSPASESDSAPYSVILEGVWRLSADHSLTFGIKKASGGASGDSLRISGKIIDVKGDSILFSVTTTDSDGTSTTYAMELTGIWSFDDHNRLNFKVEKGNGSYDPLVFRLGWEVNSFNEIVYSYQRYELKTKVKTLHSFSIKGLWKMWHDGSLVYQLEGVPGHSISFKASLSACAPDRVLYELGAAFSRRVKSAVSTITIYGSWKLRRGAGLSFEVVSRSGNISSISFTANAKLTDQDTVLFTVTDDLAEKGISVQIELNHSLLGCDGESFLRFMRSSKETSAIIGAGFSW